MFFNCRRIALNFFTGMLSHVVFLLIFFCCHLDSLIICQLGSFYYKFMLKRQIVTLLFAYLLYHDLFVFIWLCIFWITLNYSLVSSIYQYSNLIKNKFCSNQLFDGILLVFILFKEHILSNIIILPAFFLNCHHCCS